MNYFIVNPIQVGMASFFYRNRTEKTSVGELAFAFNRNDFLPVVKTMFLRGFYVFLWTLLLVIPGIIKTYEYRMVDRTSGYADEGSFKLKPSDDDGA